MRTLEKSQDKIQKIADELRKEALEPAHEEAKKIVEAAKKEADNLIHQAKEEATRIKQEAHKFIEQEKNVFYSSLEQASKQAVESLKQKIEEKVFNPEIHHHLTHAINNPKEMAKLIEVIIASIEKEGVSGDLSIAISKNIKAEELSNYLGKQIYDKLKENQVTIGDFEGGAKIKIHQENLTLDISEEAISDLIARYIRKDFRKLFFAK